MHESPTIDTTVFRSVMRRWATGVTVATFDDGGDLRGITLSSFTSVSLDPPLILVCIDRRATSHDLAARVGRFCVNILAADQRLLSDRFAGRRPGEQARFDDCSTRRTAHGAPIIDGALAWLDCRVVSAADGGDHTIFVALVEAGEAASDAAPLLFFSARYRRMAPLSPYEDGPREEVSAEAAFAWASL